MSASPLETSNAPVSHADEAIVTLLERKWPDYYPVLDSQDPIVEKQERMTATLRQIKLFGEVEGTPEKPDQVTLCNEMIERLKTEAFEPFNPKVGSAIANSLQAALAILSPGAEHKYENESKEYQAFANYYIMLAALSSEFGVITPTESTRKYGLNPYPAELGGDKTHPFNDGSQRNTYYVPIRGDFGAKELRDYDENGQLIIREFLRQPAMLSVHTRPGVRAAFSLSQFTSNQKHLRQKVEWRNRGTTQPFNDFSIRLDKDDTYHTGFSLDIGRDVRDTETMYRPGDVVGAALQAARPEYGSHFPEYFAGVSEADFDEFIDNLSKFLRADAEMARLDMALRSRDSLNADARWERSDLWSTQHMQVVSLTSGASSGKPPFGTRSTVEQK